MMIIENKYDIGDKVYLLTDEEQKMRIVTAIFVRPNGVSYELSCGTQACPHFDFEITDEKVLV